MQKRRATGAFNHVVSLLLDNEKVVPLGNEPICMGGQIFGQTSSCAFGFRVGGPVAMGHVNVPIQDCVRVQVDIGRQMLNNRGTIGPRFDVTGSRMKTG